jgi:oxaloacetate decarboxylase alpha subunit
LSKAVATDDKRNYSVSVNGRKYTATVGVDGKVDVHINGINYITTVTEGIGDMTSSETTAALHEVIAAPLAGNIFKINVAIGQQVDPSGILIILETMKMETEAKASVAGTISEISVNAGGSVAVGDTLLTL